MKLYYLKNISIIIALLLFSKIIFPIELNIRPSLLFPPLSKIESGKTIPLFPADKTGKTSKIPTSWGGSELIQEEKNYMGFPVTAYSLTGGAYIYHRNIKLTASKIEIIGSDAVYGTLSGNVQIDETEKKVTLTSNKALYDKLAESIIMEGRPTLYYLNSNKNRTKLTAKKITRFIKDGKIILEGGIIIQDENNIILGASAIYYEKNSYMEMDNNPLIFGKDKFLTAQNIGYDYEKQTTSLNENTIIIIRKLNNYNEIENESSEKNQSEPDMIYFTGDKLISYTKSSEREQSIYLDGNARVLKNDFEFTGDHLKSFGDEYKNLESRESFIFLDKKGKIKATGELFEHDDRSGYTHITNNPKIEFLNDSGETTSTLTTVEIERFSDKKEIVARGNVVIENENGTVKGQYATYYENEKKIVVEGNPTLEKGDSKVSCGSIIIFTEENRIIMSDGIGTIKEK